MLEAPVNQKRLKNFLGELLGYYHDFELLKESLNSSVMIMEDRLVKNSAKSIQEVRDYIEEEIERVGAAVDQLGEEIECKSSSNSDKNVAKNS